jgi:hypothetical protein
MGLRDGVERFLGWYVGMMVVVVMFLCIYPLWVFLVAVVAVVMTDIGIYVGCKCSASIMQLTMLSPPNPNYWSYWQWVWVNTETSGTTTITTVSDVFDLWTMGQQQSVWDSFRLYMSKEENNQAL